METKVEKPIQKKKIKKPPSKQSLQKKEVTEKKKKDIELTLTDLRDVIKKMGSDVPPKRMPFFLEFLKNGGRAGKAYQTTHPYVSRNTANTVGHRWIKDIALTDLLTLCGLGYGRIVEDLKSTKLSKRDRLYFLMKFFKLDHVSVEQTGNLAVTILPPPRMVEPIVDITPQIKAPPEIKVKKKK